MLLATVPKVVTRAFPSLIWHIPEREKIVYLTFDDGPIPETTPWLLSMLKSFNAKATFFCVGENVKKYNYLYKRLLDEGHSVGNHTYNHLVGWKTDNQTYIENINKANNLINTNLFRPPHGLIKNSQLQLIKDDFKIVMWDVLSMDYDKSVSQEQCYRNVVNHAKPGSVIVFHDSIKAWENLKYALPKTLEYLSEKGYSFSNIDYGRLGSSKPSIIENWMHNSFLRKRA
jgi:peptidoglycan/xylan/chitin deacetylase (PgdA/CDA1 family)